MDFEETTQFSHESQQAVQEDPQETSSETTQVTVSKDFEETPTEESNGSKGGWGDIKRWFHSWMS